MKAIILLTLLAIIALSTEQSNYIVKIDWWYNSTVGKLGFYAYDGDFATYGDYFNASMPLTFYPNELEIGSAYSALSLGKYLYLSVSFLGEDQFSRYEVATNLGLDYFSLTKTSSNDILEIFN